MLFPIFYGIIAPDIATPPPKISSGRHWRTGEIGSGANPVLMADERAVGMTVDV